MEEADCPSRANWPLAVSVEKTLEKGARRRSCSADTCHEPFLHGFDDSRKTKKRDDDGEKNESKN